ncbi:putative peptide transporter ptr2 [Cladobotryum mycophilum]|uniref:Peptide transporter ptr2 n=1 Tax=Cladobotryum mycophilum TaxID=491253 RepID=A0ABR0T0K3_9HYPO
MKKLEPSAPAGDNVELTSPKQHRDELSNEASVNYPRVPGKPPLAAWLVSLVTIGERWSYYAFLGPFQNYIQNAYNDPLRPGALGLGQAKATLLVNMFLIISYTTPMVAGFLADSYFGCYRVILTSLVMYAVGVAILFVTSIPEVLHHGAGLPGLIAAMITISLALGGVKASIPPLLAEQCEQVTARVKKKPNGEQVIEDPEATLQYVFDVYYWCMNIGAQSRIVSSFIEKRVGFWATNLMSLCAILTALLIFSLSGPHGSILSPAFKAFGIGIRHGCSMDAARPNAVRQRDGKEVHWSDEFIDDLKGALFACRAFTPFIIFWLCQSQMTTNLVSQAAGMNTSGVPNDMLPTFNSITVIIALPLVSHFLYPFLRRHGISTSPLRRIAFGFLLEACAMGYAAGIQGWIYSVGPCYSRPRACPASIGGTLPNDLHVGFQVPVYFLEGLSEVFASPAGYEFAFTKAPKSMKSVIQAMYGLTAAAGSIIALALTPLDHDPAVLGMYAGISGAMFLSSIAAYIFYLNDRKY